MRQLKWMLAIELLFLLLWKQDLKSEIEQLTVHVVSVLPHDPNAFTQGLAIHQNHLYESTGLYGKSSLREIDLANGRILRQVWLPSQYFAEGLAIAKDCLIQLTWKEQRAFVYDLKSLKFLTIIPYEGEGWGLCESGNQLLMSDGSSTIFIRDKFTLRLLKSFQVIHKNKPVDYINDLECVDNTIYANVWKKDIILKVDKETGRVVGIIDASKLLSALERKLLGPEDVLNGISYHDERQTFFITGKRWPKIFEVQFISDIDKKSYSWN